MKYTNESAAGRARAASFNKPERPVGTFSTAPEPVQKVDPSVRLGPIKGDLLGNVPMERQMAKPAAYQAKKGT